MSPNQPQPKGLHCPECQAHRLTVVCTKSPTPGVRIRYRKCSVCGYRFKTREVVIRMMPAGDTRKKRRMPPAG